jgi:hypothetical protein
MKARRFLRAVYRDNQLRRTDIRRGLHSDLALHLKNRAVRRLDTLFRYRYASADVPIALIVDESRYAALCGACGVSGSAHLPAFRWKLSEQRQV